VVTGNAHSKSGTLYLIGKVEGSTLLNRATWKRRSLVASEVPVA